MLPKDAQQAAAQATTERRCLPRPASISVAHVCKCMSALVVAARLRSGAVGAHPKQVPCLTDAQSIQFREMHEVVYKRVIRLLFVSGALGGLHRNDTAGWRDL